MHSKQVSPGSALLLFTQPTAASASSRVLKKRRRLTRASGHYSCPSHLELVLGKIVLVEPFLKPVNSFLFQRARAARLFATVADLVFIAPAALPPPAEMKGVLTLNDIPRGRHRHFFQQWGPRPHQLMVELELMMSIMSRKR